MTLLGRCDSSSGFFLMSRDLGHTGSVSQWTLELKVVQPLRIYPYMRIGRCLLASIRFSSAYDGRYHHDLGPVPNRDPRLLDACLTSRARESLLSCCQLNENSSHDLTGNAIREAVRAGEIVIEPFSESQLGPNSYDFRLGDRCCCTGL